MRRLLLTAGIVYAITGFTGLAMAQTTMPGTVVSNTTGDQVRMVGNDLPQVAKPVGKPINMPTSNPLLRPYNVSNPLESLQGTGLSASLVVAPVNGYSSAVEPSMFQQISNSVKSILGITSPPTVQRIYTPGIARRDRERVKERLMIRD
jgi:hypothetical protein